MKSQNGKSPTRMKKSGKFYCSRTGRVKRKMFNIQTLKQVAVKYVKVVPLRHSTSESSTLKTRLPKLFRNTTSAKYGKSQLF